MDAARKLKFESPSFAQRLKSMLGVDFYRLFRDRPKLCVNLP